MWDADVRAIEDRARVEANRIQRRAFKRGVDLSHSDARGIRLDLLERQIWEHLHGAPFRRVSATESPDAFKDDALTRTMAMIQSGSLPLPG
jgi:hypothetical protein